MPVWEPLFDINDMVANDSTEMFMDRIVSILRMVDDGKQVHWATDSVMQYCTITDTHSYCTVFPLILHCKKSAKSRRDTAGLYRRRLCGRREGKQAYRTQVLLACQRGANRSQSSSSHGPDSARGRARTA